MTQSRSNAVTQGAICTWVARLTPSDRGAIAVITCAGTPTLIRDARAGGAAFFGPSTRAVPPGRREGCRVSRAVAPRCGHDELMYGLVV